MEILATNHDLRTFRGNPFRRYPTDGKASSRLYRLGSRIHRQKFVIAEEFASKFHVFTKYISMKGTRHERKPLRLLHQGLYDLRMAMSFANAEYPDKKSK